MAAIIGTQTIDGVYIINVDADPTTGGGTVAPIGSYALVNDGNGTYFKSTSLATGWIRLPNTLTFGKVRVVYLVQDSSDSTAMGSGSGQNNVYTTFQEAYDAANTLQTTLGGTNKVIIQVGNTTAATVGNVILTANWNENVWMNGLSLLESEVGTITGDNAAGAGFSVGRTLITQQVRFSNIKVGNISVSATGTTGSSGSIGIAGSNAQFGNLNTNITNVLNTTGNGGTVRFTFGINFSHLIIGTITTNSKATTTSAGSVLILSSTVSIGVITTAVSNLGGTISVTPFGGGTISGITTTSLGGGGGITVSKCIVGLCSITLTSASVSFTDCSSNGENISVLGSTAITCTIINTSFTAYISNSFVTTKSRNSYFRTIDNLGNDSVLSNTSIDGGGYGINVIGTDCYLISTVITPVSGLSIDNTSAVTVFSDTTTFIKALGANITMSLIGGVFPLVDDGAGNFEFDADLYKHAIMDLTGLGGGANTLTFNNAAIGETYILYVINSTGVDTLSITNAVYSGGIYVPTPIAGAVDRLLITVYDATTIYVATAGTNFS